MPTLPSRQVDKIPAVPKREKEMQVLCLGLSRTGTLSLSIALRILGYTPFHGTQLMKSKDRHVKCWTEALTDKYYTGKTFGRAEFDKLLQHHDAVTDAPCCLFPQELIEAYPQAKVILTTRSPESWLLSIEYLVQSINRWSSWNPVLIYSPNGWGGMRGLFRIMLMHWTSGDPQNRAALRSGFLAHNDFVRSIAPEDFLDFQIQEGWEPLCRFLGKPIPDEPFPRVNEGYWMGDTVRKILITKAVQGFAVPLAVVGLSWLAWYYGWRV